MKNKGLKIIAVALIVATAFTVILTGCKKHEDTTPETTAPETETTEAVEIEVTRRAQTNTGSSVGGPEDLYTIQDNGEYVVLGGHDLD